MARATTPLTTTGTAPVRALTIAALAGLGFAAASTWVHYRILRDPLYSSICDVNATFSCTEAYTSRYGSIGGVPVALIGVLYFAFVLVLIALCSRSALRAAEPRRLCLRCLDARPCSRALSRLRIVLRVESGLPALRGHLRRHHRAVPHFWRSGKYPMTTSSGSGLQRYAHVVSDAGRAHDGCSCSSAPPSSRW